MLTKHFLLQSIIPGMYVISHTQGKQFLMCMFEVCYSGVCLCDACVLFYQAFLIQVPL